MLSWGPHIHWPGVPPPPMHGHRGPPLFPLSSSAQKKTCVLPTESPADPSPRRAPAGVRGALGQAQGGRLSLSFLGPGLYVGVSATGADQQRCPEERRSRQTDGSWVRLEAVSSSFPSLVLSALAAPSPFKINTGLHKRRMNTSSLCQKFSVTDTTCEGLPRTLLPAVLRPLPRGGNHS